MIRTFLIFFVLLATARLVTVSAASAPVFPSEVPDWSLIAAYNDVFSVSHTLVGLSYFLVASGLVLALWALYRNSVPARAPREARQEMPATPARRFSTGARLSAN